MNESKPTLDHRAPRVTLNQPAPMPPDELTAYIRDAITIKLALDAAFEALAVEWDSLGST